MEAAYTEAGKKQNFEEMNDFQGVISTCLHFLRESELRATLALLKEADPILQKERGPLSLSAISHFLSLLSPSLYNPFLH